MQLLARVGIAVGEVAHLAWLNLLRSKPETIEIATFRRHLSLEVVLFIANVCARTAPGKTTLRLLNTREHLHAVVEERVRLDVVHDREGKFLGVGTVMLDLEEEPLGVSLCVRVILQNQVELVFVCVNGSGQIARLEL